MDAYDYGLPEDAIAQVPVEPRSAARLLVSGRVSALGGMEHATMADLPSLLRTGDVVVVNDTRVLAARLQLVKVTGGGRAEVLLLEPIDGTGSTWEALVRPGRRLPPGTGSLHVEVGDRTEAGGSRLGKPMPGEGTARRSVRLIDPTASIERSVARCRCRPTSVTSRLDDPERYQTVLCRRSGSG